MENQEQREFWERVLKQYTEINEKLTVIDKKLDERNSPDQYFKSSFHALMEVHSSNTGLLFLIKGNLERGE